MATAAIAKEENFMVDRGLMFRMLRLFRSEIVSAASMNLRTRIMRPWAKERCGVGGMFAASSSSLEIFVGVGATDVCRFWVPSDDFGLNLCKILCCKCKRKVSSPEIDVTAVPNVPHKITFQCYNQPSKSDPPSTFNPVNPSFKQYWKPIFVELLHLFIQSCCHKLLLKSEIILIWVCPFVQWMLPSNTLPHDVYCCCLTVRRLTGAGFLLFCCCILTSLTKISSP